VEHRLAQRRRGGSPTHPGGPGRFEMRAGHQCRNDGTHVDDVRATPSGGAFQDLRNRRTQMPSCPAPSHDKSCQFVQEPLSALLRRPTPCSRSPPRCGTADWLASSLVSCEPARPATRFSVWASTAWIWLRRQFSRPRGGRASGCEACRVGGGDRGGSGECLAALRAASPSTRIQTRPVSLTGIKTAGNPELVVQGNHRQG